MGEVIYVGTTNPKDPSSTDYHSSTYLIPANILPHIPARRKTIKTMIHHKCWISFCIILPQLQRSRCLPLIILSPFLSTRITPQLHLWWISPDVYHRYELSTIRTMILIVSHHFFILLYTIDVYQILSLG